jgi:hypothetical protein
VVFVIVNKTFVIELKPATPNEPRKPNIPQEEEFSVNKIG